MHDAVLALLATVMADGAGIAVTATIDETELTRFGVDPTQAWVDPLDSW